MGEGFAHTYMHQETSQVMSLTLFPKEEIPAPQQMRDTQLFFQMSLSCLLSYNKHKLYLENKANQVRGTAQWVKKLAAKSSDWSLFLWLHMVEEENLCHKLSSDLHVNTVPCACPCPYSPRQRNKSNLQ